ncbi:hypothetical protein MMC30_008938 [Trapelia coarctata]|nr:hypothetical protein [Trapelia coarctata]
MAKQVVQPMEHFPMLAGCAIRLGQSRSPSLEQLAETTVLKLTGRTSANPLHPFRFMELPRELRRQILWHTDLVAPSVLEWDSNGDYYDPTRRLRPLGEWESMCCMRCTESGEACCCIVNHASFSSRQCICWRFPAALFHVNKEFKHHATKLFFSANQFLIWEDISLEHNHLQILATLLLLRRLPASALKYLRWLRFSFRKVLPDITLNTSSIPDPWQQAADMIHRHLVTSKLTIELDCKYQFRYKYGEARPEEEDRWNLYQTLASVFQSKGPFKDFFVHLGPFVDLPREEDSLRLDRERVLEKRIMGAGFNAVARDKYKNRGKSLYDIFLEQPPTFGPDGVRLNPRWRGEP